MLVQIGIIWVPFPARVSTQPRIRGQLRAGSIGVTADRRGHVGGLGRLLAAFRHGVVMVGLAIARTGAGSAGCADRQGFGGAGRSPVPAAGVRRPGRGCRRGGSCGRFLPGPVPPPGVRRDPGRGPGPGCGVRGPGRLAEERVSSSPRLLSVSAWPWRPPMSRNSSSAWPRLAAAAG